MTNARVGDALLAGAAAVLLCAALVACESDEEPPVEEDPLAGQWIPQEAGSVSWKPGFDPRTVEVSFDDGTWTGNNGCTTLVGSYELSGEDEFVATGEFDRECLGDSVPYDVLLVNSNRVDASEDELQFYDDEGELLLRLSRSE